MKETKKAGFYGVYARIVISCARLFVRKYDCTDIRQEGAAVYVCRHLDMHGPIEAVVNMPFHVHPLTLHVFMDRTACRKQLSDYTFTERAGRKKTLWRDLGARIAACVIVPLMHSLRAVPVYRETGEAIKTMRRGLACLQKGESLMLWPDVEYTGEYGQAFEIYTGFLFLGELYKKRTGKELKFIPLVLDEKAGRMIPGEPVIVNDFKTEAREGAERIKQGIDGSSGGTKV